MSTSRKTTPGPSQYGVSSASSFSSSSSRPSTRPAIELTPPPDNYALIGPCYHVESVLASKAKETVFLTYRQAVIIAQSVSPDKVYRSKKDGGEIPHNRLIHKKSESLKCSDCSLNNFQHNFICLQCPHVGCFNNHAYTHYKLQQHLFGIDSHNGLLYCFLCGDYVNHPQLEQIRSEIADGTSAHVSDQNTELIANNYSDPAIKTISGLKGFVNLGATCFMSSILQTLIHNPFVKYRFFNNDFHYFNCDKNDGEPADEYNACITCSIDNIFQNFYTSGTNEGFGMTNLLTTAWYKKKSLAGFQEQDAHEFWQFILNEFHLDHERIQTNLGHASPSLSDSGCTCITHTTFAGELQSSIQCLSCKSVTRTIDPMMDLSLEINHLKNKKGVTLYDCLDLYTLEEKLDVMYTCRSCGEKTKAIKSLKIKTLAPVVSIQLKRFEHNFNETPTKIDTPVITPLYLNLTKYAYDAGASMGVDGTKVYELFALVCHIGSVNTGHYIVLIKNGAGQWFKFDDSVITLVSQDEVTTSNAYLLFYITHRI
ncbi:cysteine proteinase [Suhomyces tanzawaensis NRRL Y-17324]|uniref:Ubiquitin carboxyl-terminal hydrolase n=1 Tax=Suhomyces tanzawaensis NRRL Y-17324 TaxID=984487 RepID=A0A1E4SSD7_9ASCO|nr:cysteine proteinase [Suhomyces tanzawaensis NRRL Y-17324]ODV82430.1 cysteine proteinase [Suhomyces tanzawaensis NRRL Y-17324]